MERKRRKGLEERGRRSRRSRGGRSRSSINPIIISSLCQWSTSTPFSINPPKKNKKKKHPKSRDVAVLGHISRVTVEYYSNGTNT